MESLHLLSHRADDLFVRAKDPVRLPRVGRCDEDQESNEDIGHRVGERRCNPLELMVRAQSLACPMGTPIADHERIMPVEP